MEPTTTYHDNGQVSYEKNDLGIECWYDDNGNLTHYRDSNGYEDWREYDANGNFTHYRDSTGFEIWWEYDDNGNRTHYRNSYGFELREKHDDSSNKEIPKEFNRDACIEFVKTRNLKSINSLFDWGDTPQGYLHWSCVRGGIKHITDADIIQIQSWIIASLQSS